MTKLKHVLGGAVAAVSLAASLSTGARAEVVDPQPNGFSLQQKIEIAAPPAKVYAALVDVAKWWSSSHTFSGDAANMSLDVHAGGCWCEKLPGGGSVLHMTVVFVEPGKVLRLRGALGPFQSTGMDGAMTITLDPVKKKAGHTELMLSYNLGGYVWGGYGALPTTADGVLNQQIRRLKNYVETGSADPKQ